MAGLSQGLNSTWRHMHTGRSKDSSVSMTSMPTNQNNDMPCMLPTHIEPQTGHINLTLGTQNSSQDEHLIQMEISRMKRATSAYLVSH